MTHIKGQLEVLTVYSRRKLMTGPGYLEVLIDMGWIIFKGFIFSPVKWIGPKQPLLLQ